MMLKMKDCYKCGTKPKGESFFGDGWIVFCPKCRHYWEDATRYNAVKEWNRITAKHGGNNADNDK